MKVAILTQPLGHNYGGLLQAYALQIYLKSIGCEVVTIDLRAADPDAITQFTTTMRVTWHWLLGRLKTYPTAKKHEFIIKNLNQFKKQNIEISPRLSSKDMLIEYFKINDFDAIVVGSDQVWRPKYSPFIENFFLDFYDDVAIRISYAASFGVDFWEFNDKQTEAIKKYIKKFNAVSVREESAVELCKEHLNIVAEWVVDPTLLLQPLEYVKLMPSQGVVDVSGKLLSYILDPAKEKQEIATEIATKLKLETFSIKPENDYRKMSSKEIEACQYPKVELWLQSFYSAEFIVTDSFHGCIFAILFNKPFIAVGNLVRGLARFETLFSKFNLKDRLVLSLKDVTEKKITAKIDWEAVNFKREIYAKEGKEFFNNNLLKAGFSE